MMTDQEFIEKFKKKWGKKTSTFPSGLSLSHYQASTKPHSAKEKDEGHAERKKQRRELIAAHATLNNCAPKFGHTCN